MTSSTPRNPLLWGAYLACSWTWCIGMFLPALLLRDMGGAGFWIFAVPNVVGAAAMGWVIQSRTASDHFVKNHAQAIWWFSAITLAFHFFWMCWIARFLWLAFNVPDALGFGLLGAGLGVAFLSSRWIGGGRAPQLAVGLLVFSVGIFCATFFNADLSEQSNALIAAAPSSFAPLWMLPVMGFGFLLCPYLDITFHHARQQLGSRENGRLGFTLGFVGFFFIMILLTTRYAGVLDGILAGSHTLSGIPWWVALGVLLHLLLQWIFTVCVHFDRIRTIPGHHSKIKVLWTVVILSGAVGFFAVQLPEHAGLSGGEVIYRSFMGAYGLVFPAYLLYRVVIRHNSSTASLRMWVAVALAFPLFWLGFIERQTIWLVPGISLVLLGAWIPFLQRRR